MYNNIKPTFEKIIRVQGEKWEEDICQALKKDHWLQQIFFCSQMERLEQRKMLTLKKSELEKGGGAYRFPDCFCLFFLYHPWIIYTIKVHIAWEHSSFTNMDLVAIQRSDPQARIFNSQIFNKVWYFPPKSSEGCNKFTPEDRPLDLFVNGHKWVPSSS